MTTSTSRAQWDGDLKGGSGTMTVGADRWTGEYTFASRFEGSGDASTPEELVGAAHAGCFSMFLANILATDGHTPDVIRTQADVVLDRNDGGPAITAIVLRTSGEVPGIDQATFEEYAEKAKNGCPVSKLYAGGTADITVEATLST